MMEKKKVLIVDDQPPVCQSVGRILRKGGCEVAEAFDGEAALAALEKERFDLVIADLMMPRLSGMELLRYVKQHHPEVEVVMITGYASIESAVEATKIGAAGYVPKPFTPQELTSVVEKALANAKPPVPEQTEKTEPAEQAKGGKVDQDIPFDRRELEKATSPAYADSVGRSDAPTAGRTADPTWCPKGQRSCQRFVKAGPCKGEVCPLVAREKRLAHRRAATARPIGRRLVDVDAPFSFAAVAEATSPIYAATLGRGDMPLPALVSEQAMQGRNILVIDDEPVVCQSLRRILGRQGHRVEQALEPDEGLEKIAANGYDLVLLDLRMPGRDGLDVLTTIKQRWPETKVIIVTGYASIESAVEATRRGATNYVAKPFTPEEIVRATREALEEEAA